jgi:hypothetical protein
MQQSVLEAFHETLESGADRERIPRQTSVEELALLDELDRLARLRSSTPPCEDDQGGSSLRRPADWPDGQLRERSPSQHASLDPRSERSTDHGHSQRLATEPLFENDAHVRFVRDGRAHRSRRMRFIGSCGSRGHLPLTRSTSTLTDLGRQYAIEEITSVSAQQNAGFNASPRIQQPAVATPRRRGYLRSFAATTSSGELEQRQQPTPDVLNTAIIGRVATTVAADWTDDFCFPDRIPQEQVMDQRPQLPDHATMGLHPLFRVPSAPTLTSSASGGITRGSGVHQSSPSTSLRSTFRNQRKPDVAVNGSEAPASNEKLFSGSVPLAMRAHAAGQVQPSPTVGVAGSSAGGERSPATGRNRSNMNTPETLVAASLSPRTRMIMRTGRLADNLWLGARAPAPKVARELSAVFDGQRQGRQSAFPPAHRSRSPERKSPASGAGFRVEPASAPPALRGTVPLSPLPSGPAKQPSPTPSLASTQSTSTEDSESASDSDWDAELGHQYRTSTAGEAGALSDFIPATYTFDGSAGAPSTFEDGVIPAFFRIVDRARALYRGRVIMRYPRPSSLVFLRLPETRASQLAEKELELWLIGLVTSSLGSPFEHPLIPPPVRQWVQSPANLQKLSGLGEHSNGKLLRACSDLHSYMPWVPLVALSITQVSECVRSCRARRRAKLAFANLQRCLLLVDALGMQPDWLPVLEPWLASYLFPTLGTLLFRVYAQARIDRGGIPHLVTLLDRALSSLSSQASASVQWQARLIIAELLLQFGPDLDAPLKKTCWERVCRDALHCLGHYADVLTAELESTTADLAPEAEDASSLSAQQQSMDLVAPDGHGVRAASFGSIQVIARAACLLYWLLQGVSPFNLEPLDYDTAALYDAWATTFWQLPQELRPHLHSPDALCEFLIQKCCPLLPRHCESRYRCSTVLGHRASLTGHYGEAESHFFEALVVMHGCPPLVDASPCVSEFAQSVLERYAECLRQGAKYRYAVAALTAAADAFLERTGQSPNLLLQRISELALSEQDYVRAIQANIALLRAVSLEGQLLQAIHVTLRLGYVLVEAGWFIRAEQLLTAVWHALEDAAASIASATQGISSEPLLTSLTREETRMNLSRSTTETPSRTNSERSDWLPWDPAERRVPSPSARTERRTIESHLSDILLLLADVRIRAGRLASAFQPLMQLQQLLPPARQAIIHRKLADIWLRLGNPVACRQAYLRYLAMSCAGTSTSTSKGAAVATSAASAGAPAPCQVLMSTAQAPQETSNYTPKDVASATESRANARDSLHMQSIEVERLPGHDPFPVAAAASTAACIDNLDRARTFQLVRGRAPPEATILALLYEEQFLDALAEIDCAMEMTSFRRLRNLARLMHLRGQVLREMAYHLDSGSVLQAALPASVTIEVLPQLRLSRLRLVPPLKLVQQLPDAMQRTWKRWLAESIRWASREPPSPVDVIKAARLSFAAAAYLYSVMADEIYAALSTVAALRMGIEWALRRFVRAEPDITAPAATYQEGGALTKAPANDNDNDNDDAEQCEERLLEAASIFMETNMVQASMEVSITMAQLMILRQQPEAGVAFLREAWATFSSLYVDARNGRFAFTRLASPLLLRELRQLLSRMVLVLYCLPSAVVLELHAMLDIHNQLSLETVLAEARSATRTGLSGMPPVLGQSSALARYRSSTDASVERSTNATNGPGESAAKASASRHCSEAPKTTPASSSSSSVTATRPRRTAPPRARIANGLGSSAPNWTASEPPDVASSKHPWKRIGALWRQTKRVLGRGMPRSSRPERQPEPAVALGTNDAVSRQPSTYSPVLQHQQALHPQRPTEHGQQTPFSRSIRASKSKQTAAAPGARGEAAPSTPVSLASSALQRTASQRAPRVQVSDDRAPPLQQCSRMKTPTTPAQVAVATEVMGASAKRKSPWHQILRQQRDIPQGKRDDAMLSSHSLSSGNKAAGTRAASSETRDMSSSSSSSSTPARLVHQTTAAQARQHCTSTSTRSTLAGAQRAGTSTAGRLLLATASSSHAGSVPGIQHAAVSEATELGPLFSQACNQIVRDVLDDTKRSETAQLYALLQQLDWYEAHSPTMLNALFGSDDPVQVAWAMQQRFEMQTERYRRGEVSTAELALANEESLEIWLHEMGKLSEVHPAAAAQSISPTALDNVVARQVDKAHRHVNAANAPVATTNTTSARTSCTASASASASAMPHDQHDGERSAGANVHLASTHGTAAFSAAAAAAATSAAAPSPLSLPALTSTAPDLLFICNVGGLVCVYNLQNGFRYLFTWEPCQFRDAASDTCLNGWFLLPHSAARDELSAGHALPPSQPVDALCPLHTLHAASALFVPITTMEASPWVVCPKNPQPIPCSTADHQRREHPATVASLLGIRREHWLRSASAQDLSNTSTPSSGLGLLVCDLTLSLVPWELLLETPLMRAFSLRDHCDRCTCLDHDAADIAQLVVFQSPLPGPMLATHRTEEAVGDRLVFAPIDVDVDVDDKTLETPLISATATASTCSLRARSVVAAHQAALTGDTEMRPERDVASTSDHQCSGPNSGICSGWCWSADTNWETTGSGNLICAAPATPALDAKDPTPWLPYQLSDGAEHPEPLLCIDGVSLASVTSRSSIHDARATTTTAAAAAAAAAAANRGVALEPLVQVLPLTAREAALRTDDHERPGLGIQARSSAGASQEAHLDQLTSVLAAGNAAATCAPPAPETSSCLVTGTQQQLPHVTPSASMLPQFSGQSPACLSAEPTAGTTGKHRLLQQTTGASDAPFGDERARPGTPLSCSGDTAPRSSSFGTPMATTTTMSSSLPHGSNRSTASDLIAALGVFPFHELAYPGRVLREIRAVCPSSITAFVPLPYLPLFERAVLQVLHIHEGNRRVRSVQQLVETLLRTFLEQQIPVAFVHGHFD